MIKIIKGYYGPALSGPGTELSLPEYEENRLVKLGIAEKIGSNKFLKVAPVQQKISVENIQQDTITEQVQRGLNFEPIQIETNVNNTGITSDEDEEVFKTEEEIRSMKKEELVSYAEEIGIEEFDPNTKKEIMVDSILNYIDENSIEVEE